MPFVKLDTGLLDSSLWPQRGARELFITALLMAEPRELTAPTPTLQIRNLDADPFVCPPGWFGFVPAAGPGIIRRAGMDIEPGLIALEELAAPDPESRSQDYQGRRMVRVDGGYVILNYCKYRDRDYTNADRQARFRERKRERNAVTPLRNTVTGRYVTQAEAEYIVEDGTAQKQKKAVRPAEAGPASNQTDETWLAGLKADPAYQGIDVDREHAKCIRWCSERKKQATRKRFLNWLNNADRPLTGQLTGHQPQPAPASELPILT